jgi:serine/threonine-protein kinase RsbW
VNDAAVQLTFPAKADYLLLARLALAGLARSLPVDAEGLADLKLAVTEACGNAVRHAYPEAGGGQVAVSLTIADDALEMIVEDRGSGMGASRHEVREPGDPLPEGGMGLAIIRAVVDELRIDAGAEGRGTIVHMTKRFPPPG